MTFNYKTRIDPKTGRAETYIDDATDEQAKADKLARDKRELRDMLAGNLPFHTDPHASPIPAPEAKELPPLDWDDFDASGFGPGCVLADRVTATEVRRAYAEFLRGHWINHA